MKSQVDLEIGTTQSRLVADVERLKSDEPGKPDKPSDLATVRAPSRYKTPQATSSSKSMWAPGNAPRLLSAMPPALRVELVADPKGSHLRVSTTRTNPRSSASVRQRRRRPVLAKEATKSSVSLPPTKPALASCECSAQAAKPVGAMFSDAEGGRVALTSATGGKTALSLAVTPTGGRCVCFLRKAASARAELSADGATGSVNLSLPVTERTLRP